LAESRLRLRLRREFGGMAEESRTSQIPSRGGRYLFYPTTEEMRKGKEVRRTRSRPHGERWWFEDEQKDRTGQEKVNECSDEPEEELRVEHGWHERGGLDDWAGGRVRNRGALRDDGPAKFCRPLAAGARGGLGCATASHQPTES
jgi:hypothetical protein